MSVAFKELDFNYPNANKLIDAISNLEKVVQNGDYIKLPPFKTLRIGDQSEVVKKFKTKINAKSRVNKNL